LGEAPKVGIGGLMELFCRAKSLAGLKNEPGGLDSGPGDFISFVIWLKIKVENFRV